MLPNVGRDRTFFRHDAEGRLKQKGLYVPGIGRALVDGGRRYSVTDHLSSVRAVLDGSGNVQEAGGYYSFGSPLDGRYDESASPTREDVTGHVKDDSTDLHYAGARYYSGAFARWLGPDPILGEKSLKKLLKQVARLLTMSSYNYAFDNPATLTDPTGLAPNDIIFQGEGGNTLRINTARKEVTTFELDFKLKESGEISLPNFKEMSSNFALGIQYAVSNTEMVGTGSNQEAFI